MTSVRITPVLAGATALALLMGSAAVAQQQSSGQQGQAQDTAAQQGQTQQTQQGQTQQDQAQGQAQPADQQQAASTGSAPQSGQMQQSFAQVRQLLDQAQRSMQQDDPDTARDALEQANRLLQEPPGDVDEQQFLDLQAQLQQALDALDNGDMETAQAAIDEANATLQSVQQASQQGGSQQATSQQATSQQSGQQAPMQQGGQMSQEAIQQLRDQIEMARLDLQSAMDSVEQASRALDNIQPDMAAGGSQSLDVTVIRGDAAQTEAQTEAQTGQPQQGAVAVVEAEREVPRLSPEETHRLLGIGDRQIGQAAELVTVSVADLEDRKVVSYEGERIGEIGNVVNSGGQAVAIIEHGGFLGIGENKVAVPLDRLGMRGDDLVLLGLTEEQMKALPDFDFNAGEEMRSEDAIEIGRYE